MFKVMYRLLLGDYSCFVAFKKIQTILTVFMERCGFENSIKVSTIKVASYM